MRRRILIALSLGVSLGGAILGGVAHAAPETLCSVSQSGLTAATGLTATPSGYALSNDEGISQGKKTRVYLVDNSCKVTKTLQSSHDPYDQEDLARTADGTFWIADTGDDSKSRARVAVHVFPTNGEPAITRFTYPDGRHDVRAMVIQHGNTPLFITYEAGDIARLYVATKPVPLADEDLVIPLKSAGTVTLPPGEASLGRSGVTGAALAPDGTRVALRTSTHAFLWSVSGGDVVKALTTETPTRVALEGASGEAISFSEDGSSLVTTGPGSPVALQRWSIAAPAAATSPSAAPSPSAQATTEASSSLGYAGFSRVVLGVGVVGVLLVVIGVIGIIRFRRRQRRAAAEDPYASPSAPPVAGPAQTSQFAAAQYGAYSPDSSPPLDQGGYRGGPYAEPPHGAGQPYPGTVYGHQGGATPMAQPYGAPTPGGAPQGGTVYGGGGAGTVYDTPPPASTSTYGGSSGTVYGAPQGTVYGGESPGYAPPTAPPLHGQYGEAPTSPPPPVRGGTVYGRPSATPPPDPWGADDQHWRG